MKSSVIGRVIRHGIAIKIKNGKEEIKVALSVDDMILYRRDPMDSTRKPLDPITLMVV